MNNSTDALIEAEDRFRCLMNLQDPTFKHRVEKRAHDLAHAIGGVPDEYVAEFNKVLPGGGFKYPPIMGALTTSPVIAKETAAILCKVSLGKGLVKRQKKRGIQHLGWNNLNKDAKGWCKALLLSHPPNGATLYELRDLLTAKLFAAILVDHLLPCSPRAVAEIDKTTVLEPPVDA